MNRIKLKFAVITLSALSALSFDALAAPVQWTVAAGGNDHWYEIVSVPNSPGSFRKSWDDARA